MPAGVAGGGGVHRARGLRRYAHSADCARAARTFTIPYTPNEVRVPYDARHRRYPPYGQYGTELVIWAGGRDLSGGTDEKGT